MGPVINQGQLDKVREFCSLGVQEGGKLLCGGKQPDGLGDEISNGYYWEPTVIGDCTAWGSEKRSSIRACLDSGLSS